MFTGLSTGAINKDFMANNSHIKVKDKQKTEDYSVFWEINKGLSS